MKDVKTVVLLAMTCLSGSCATAPKVGSGSEPVPSAPKWQPVGTEGFSKGAAESPSFAISASGIPYAAYKDTANGNRLTVMKYNGSAWESMNPASGFSKSPESAVRLAIDAKENPYLAYNDSSGLKDFILMRFNGSVWEEISDAKRNITAPFDISGATPHVLYRDTLNGDSSTVMKYNGSAWENVGSPGFSEQYKDPRKIINSKGGMYVLCENPTEYKVTVMKYDGGWKSLSTDFWIDTAGNIDLALNADDAPYILYQHGRTHETSLMKFHNGSWVYLGADPFPSASSRSFSLAIDSKGVPYVAYSDVSTDEKLAVMKFNGVEWKHVGPAKGFSAGAVKNISIGFRNGTIPYVLYRDAALGNKAVMMKFE